jgi:integrase
MPTTSARSGNPCGCLELDVYLLEGVMPFIGELYIDQIHDATLASFIVARKAAGVKNKTINLALGAVRRVLRLAAAKWRDDEGRTWLETAPLISMLPLDDQREPYQLTWTEQRRFLPLLPDHLARMALFDLNTGVRDNVVCNLRWGWEVWIEELQRSVFIVPRHYVKGRKASAVVVCNSVAQSIIDSVRGQDSEFVFVYGERRKKCRPGPVQTMNNTAWQRARKEAGLPDLHVHDLRHTVGMRLREAGVKDETRTAILWHNGRGMAQHYAVPQVREVLDALELIADERHVFNKSLTALAREARHHKVTTAAKKMGQVRKT